MNERDLRRILTTEERNALVLVGNSRGNDELDIIARRNGTTAQAMRAIVERARQKIERETRKGGRGVKTAIETTRCGCGEEFTPRHGELLCPACRELISTQPLVTANGRRAHDEPDQNLDQNLDQNSDQSDGVSVNGDGDHSDVARNPPPAQPFPRKPDVEERRAKVIAAIEEAGGEADCQAICDATGLWKTDVRNDLSKLCARDELVSVRLAKTSATSGRRVVYRTPSHQAAVERAAEEPPPEPETDGYQWPEPPRGWRYADEPGEDGRRTIEKIDGTSVGSISEDGSSIFVHPVDEVAAEKQPEEQPDEHAVCASPFCTNPVGALDLYCSEECKPGNRVAARSSTEPDPGEGEAPQPPPVPEPPVAPEPAPAEAPPPLATPEGRHRAERLLTEAERSRRAAGEFVAQLFEEAEVAARELDGMVPEGLLRARYIAALLKQIEDGDTSPELLDRFERLAFGE